MTGRSERGVAYNFWLRVKTEQAARGWNDVELQNRSGIPRGTVDRLAKGKRPPQARVVNALAEALEIDATEAHQLAQIVPRQPQSGAMSVRDAIMHDPNYTEKQRQTMLELIEIFEQANTGEGRDSAAN